ncbi:hypothetical protein [Paenalcaligenes suwonensis]|uniref:hypothetical protein n=1 Tax=Paenalcaligenes suwonensis TaxID=1202713 RepID=UPI0014091659|nr:hypothetical protein [Paenalcaligenes suwonensis]NHC63058.1 hypothetical protein [Paenalcaligenes suwonensis]
MSEPTKKKVLNGYKPKPRIQHIEPGQFFKLTEDDGGHILLMLRRCETYCYHSTGKIALGTEISPLGMAYGDEDGGTGGWRVRRES